MANKLCSKCNQSKPLSEYYKNSAPSYKKDGYDYYCKYCRKGTHLRSTQNNKKRCSIDNCDRPHYAKKMCRMHWARFNRNGTVERLIRIATDGIYRSKDGTVIGTRKNTLRRDYHITLEEYQNRSAKGCEICFDIPEASLHVDHDHSCCPGYGSCGKCIRGIVCNKCNMAIGKMEKGIMREDYPNYWLIMKYLEAYSEQAG